MLRGTAPEGTAAKAFLQARRNGINERMAEGRCGGRRWRYAATVAAGAPRVCAARYQRATL